MPVGKLPLPDVKVILIGSQHIYTLLTGCEYDFKKMFKVKADFDYEIKKSDKVLKEYARVIKKLIKESDQNVIKFNNRVIKVGGVVLEFCTRPQRIFCEKIQLSSFRT